MYIPYSVLKKVNIQCSILNQEFIMFILCSVFEANVYSLLCSEKVYIPCFVLCEYSMFYSEKTIFSLLISEDFFITFSYLKEFIPKDLISCLEFSIQSKIGHREILDKMEEFCLRCFRK